MSLISFSRVCFLLLGAGLAYADSPKVFEHELDNGMKVLVLPDQRAPVVVSQVWYKVGSSYEHNGITGVSHLLEHMMFKGTEALAPGEFSETVARFGGSDNAFTSADYTAYFQTISNEQLDRMLKMEADRMRNINITDEEFAKELEVVKEERRQRTDDNPQSLTYERFREIAYTNSPYQIPIIGWMQDLDSMEPDDARQWYQKWYAPNNATLVVVGDVQPDAVFALAEKHFGPVEVSQIDAPKPQQEVPQLGQRRLRVKQVAQVPYLVMGFKVPNYKTIDDKQDAYALEVIAGILDAGNSARFSRRLVREQELATGIGAGYDLYSRLPGLFTITAVPRDQIAVADLEAAILAEIDDLKAAKVSRDELQRVKNQVVASDVYERDSMFYQGMKLGILETVGIGWQVANEYVDSINAVTPADIQRVAKTYFNEDNLTVAELVPVQANNGDKQ